MLRRLVSVLVVALGLLGSGAMAAVPAFEAGSGSRFWETASFMAGRCIRTCCCFTPRDILMSPMMFFNLGVAGDMAKEAARRVGLGGRSRRGRA